MQMSNKRRIHINYLAVSFAIPFVGMLFVMLISGFEPFGKYSMLYSDMYHQYYPFFVEFRRILRSGGSLLHNWTIGMGTDFLGLYAYYLASPLNLFSVLVPEAVLLEFFSLLMPVKLGLAGMSFAYFLNRIFGREDLSVSMFGGFYGLCAWALGYQWNIMWLDTFAMLPMVMLGLVSLLEDKKFVLYTLSLFFSIAANYYIGLFTCFFVFLTFFVYQICRWEGWKKFFGDFFRIGVFSVLAIGMTLMITLPAVGSLQSTYSSVNKFPDSFRLNIADSHTLMGLLDAMRQVAGNMGGAIEPTFKEGLPNLYCGIISIILMFLYLMAKEIRIRDKVCAVGLLLFFNVSFIIRQLDYIWHGFHFTNMIPYRFSFLYSFVVLYMAYRAWVMRRSFSSVQILAAGLLSSGLMLLSESVKTTEKLSLGSLEMDIPVYLLYNGVFLLLYLICFLYGNIQVEIPEGSTPKEMKQLRLEQKKMRSLSVWMLIIIMSAELIGNLVCFGLYFTGTNASNYPKGTNYAASVIRYMHEREEDTLFYRAETTHSQTLNDGALNDYSGISAFTSSANVKTTQFLKTLGFSAKKNYNRYLYEETSPVSNLFLNLKYMIDRDGKDKESTYFRLVNEYGDITLLENNAYLPLGFLAQKELADVVFDDTANPFMIQNDLFVATTGIQRNVWRWIPQDNLEISSEDVEITEKSGSGYCRYTASEKGSIVYTYTADRDGFACLYLKMPARNTYRVYINDTEQYQETLSLSQLIAVGDVNAGDKVEVRITCKKDEDSSLTLSAAIMDHDLFWQGYEVLASDTLELTTFEGAYVSGVIDCSRDGLLYTSIPQNGNWEAYVDGKATPIILVGDCMVSVELTQGQHTVEFRYQNPWFSWGWKLSAVCFVLFALIVQLVYKPKWKKTTGKFSK